MTTYSIASDEAIMDDLITTRDETEAVRVRISSWLHPAQRLVLLGWIGELLDAEPRTELAFRMTAGGAVGHTRTLAGRELAELMDQRELTTEERSRVVELICAGR